MLSATPPHPQALVHPPMLSHSNPSRVLILGGGEGGTAREVLKHTTVKELVMVDLDPILVKLSEENLPYWEGVRQDSRPRSSLPPAPLLILIAGISPDSRY